MLHPGNKKRVKSPVVFTYTKVDLLFSFFLLFSNFLLQDRSFHESLGTLQSLSYLNRCFGTYPPMRSTLVRAVRVSFLGDRPQEVEVAKKTASPMEHPQM